MAEETIDIGLRIDAAEVPQEMRKALDALDQEMQQRGQIGDGALGERMTQAYSRARGLSEKEQQQGGLSKQDKQELEQNLRALDALHKRYYRDRIKESEELRKEHDHLKKSYEEQVAQYKQLGEAGATGEQKRLHPALLKKEQQVRSLYEQVTAPQRDYDTRRALIERARDEAALVQTKDTQPEPKEEKKGGMWGGLGSMALGFGKGLLGFGGAYGAYRLGSAITSGITGEKDRGIVVADMAQRLRPPGTTAEQMLERTRSLHPTLNPVEGTQFLASYSALAGRGSQPFENANKAVDLTRAMGVSPEQGANIFGQAGRLGIEQQGLFRGLGEEISNAKMRGREGEMYEALLNMAESLTERLGRVDAGQLSRVLGGMAESDIPGLQGTMGAQAALRVDQAFRSAPLLPAMDLRRVTMLETMEKLEVSDPVIMNQIQDRGLLQDPKVARALFDTIEEAGGINSYEGQQRAMGMGFSPQPEIYAAQKKGLTSDEAPTLYKFIDRMIGKTEREKIPMQNLPAALDVAKNFQEREAKKEFKSEDEMRAEFGKVLKTEAGVMETEMNARTALVKNLQDQSRRMEEGTAAYTALQKIINELAAPTLPAFKRGLEGITEILERLTPSSYGTREETNKKAAEWLIPEAFPGARKAVTKSLNWLDATGTERMSANDARWSVGTDYKTMVQDSMKWKPAPGETVGGMLWDTGKKAWNSAMGYMQQQSTDWQKDTPPAYRDFITQSSQKHNVDPSLVQRVIKRESSFNPNAVGGVGEASLMQLTPKWWPGHTKQQLFDPKTNIDLGTEHLAKGIRRFGGSEEKGVAAYNMGGEPVQKLVAKYGKEWRKHLPLYPTGDYLNEVFGEQGSGSGKQPGHDMTPGESQKFEDIKQGLRKGAPAEGIDAKSLTPEQAQKLSNIFEGFNPKMPKEAPGYLESSMGGSKSSSSGELGLTGSLRVTVDVNQDGRTTSTTRTMGTGDGSLNIDLMSAAPGGRGLHAKQNSPNLASAT